MKIRGFRIELGEIEAALGQHPSVREAVVLAQEDAAGDRPASLSTEKRLVAYVCAEREPVPTTTDLRKFLAEKLPEHMVPAIFVLLSAFPLLPNGKIDRRALRLSERTRPELDNAFVAPRGPVEEIIGRDLVPDSRHRTGWHRRRLLCPRRPFAVGNSTHVPRARSLPGGNPAAPSVRGSNRGWPGRKHRGRPAGRAEFVGPPHPAGPTER